MKQKLVKLLLVSLPYLRKSGFILILIGQSISSNLDIIFKEFIETL